jgi:hypothetical protein
MTAAAESTRAVQGDRAGGRLPTLPPTPALDRIAVLLRHFDTQLAAVRGEVSLSRRLSVLADVPDLDRVLGPVERAIGATADRLGLEPIVLDGRRALRGTLHILWADLIDLSPEKLRRQWGLDDIPCDWAQSHRQLLAAVEEAITLL